MTPANINALDRLHEVSACYRAVEELSIPSLDAHIINRDNLAILLSVLNRLHDEALIALQKAG